MERCNCTTVSWIHSAASTSHYPILGAAVASDTQWPRQAWMPCWFCGADLVGIGYQALQRLHLLVDPAPPPLIGEVVQLGRAGALAAGFGGGAGGQKLEPLRVINSRPLDIL